MNTLEQTLKVLDQLDDAKLQLTQKYFDVWQSLVLFTWRWWIGILITVIVWLFWFWFHKKESRYRLLTAGFFVMVVSVSLDAIGVQLGLWSYRFQASPFIPAYIPYDLALMPVVIMSLIQYKPHISPYIKAIIFGLMAAFIGEPTIVYLDIYKLRMWEYIYSAPVYMAVFLIAYRLTTQTKFETLK